MESLYNITVSDIEAHADSLLEFHADFADFFRSATRSVAPHALDYLQGPRAVFAHAANLAQDHHAVDDNSILIMKFDRAMAVVEGTWTERFELPWTTFIVGEEGALMADYHTGELVRFDGDHESGAPVALKPAPAGQRNGPEYFVARLQSGAPIEGPSTARRGRDVQEVLQAGLISMAEGREVELPLEG